MFVRISKIKAGGKVYEYIRIVENYKRKGKSHQRVVANLGRAEDVRGKLDGLVEKLREYCKEKFVKREEIKGEEAPIWGPILVARKLWNDIGLGEIIKKRCSNGKRKIKIEETAFVLVASSFIDPSSEHGISWWLDRSYVCDSNGRRFLPQWRENVTKEDRVRIEWKQLNIWYRTLDSLIGAKEEIEKDIYLRLRDLFGFKVDIVFYDITSLYFEGDGPKGLAEYGKSKDGKDRNKQILLGIVMVSGWPVAHHVFSGNMAETKTVSGVVDDLKGRFNIDKLIFVGDAGMMSEDNVNYITSPETQYKYIIAMKRRRNNEADKALENIGKEWEACKNGTVAQEVKIEGTRYIIAKSEERKKYEKAIRMNNMEATRKGLEELKKRVLSGKLKNREKIGYNVSAILNKVKGYRYFSWKAPKDGEFYYWDDKEKIKKEKRIEGVYMLKTNDEDMKPAAVVTAYKELTDVEGAFREFKDVLEGRPIYHQTANRVKAHVFVRALAYLLDTALKKAMKRAGMDLTVEEAIKALSRISIADLRLKGEKYQIVVGVKGYGRSVLNAVGLRGQDLLPHQERLRISAKKCAKMAKVVTNWE